MGEIISVFAVFLFISVIFYFLLTKKYTEVVNTLIIFYMVRGTLYRIGYKMEHDITIFAVELAILVLSIYTFLSGGIKVSYKMNILSVIFVLYFWMFISAIFTYPNIIVGLYGIRWVVIPPMFLFFLHRYSKYIDFSKVVKILFIMSLVNIVYAIVQSIYFPPFDYPPEILSNPLYKAILKGEWIGIDLPIMIGYKIRPYGFLSNIVVFNNTIPMLILFLMVISHHDESVKKRIYVLMFFYIIYLVMNFYEKAQLLTFGIGTVVFSIFLMKIRKSVILPLLYVLIVVFVFLIGFVYSKETYKQKEYDPYMKRFLEVFNPIEGTGKYRFMAWHRAINKFIEKPYGWGVGYARSTSVIKGKMPSPHNMFLQFLVEGGIVGFLIFVVMYLYFIYYFIYYGIKGNYYAVAFAVVLIAIGIYGMGTSFMERLNSFIFWLLFYISYYYVRREYEKDLD